MGLFLLLREPGCWRQSTNNTPPSNYRLPRRNVIRPIDVRVYCDARPLFLPLLSFQGEG